MSNHIHLIWQVLPDKIAQQVQHSFMKYTAQQIKFDLVANHLVVLEKFRVNAKDRTYQFWERNPLGVELRSHDVFMQKLKYIHWNPVKAGLCSLPEEYYYSSAKFYWTGIDDYALVGLMTNNLNLISCNVFCKIAGKQCLLVIRPTRAFQIFFALKLLKEAFGK